MGLKLRVGRRDARLRAGTSMVEMVFVTPLLLVLVFGIAEFGVAFGQWLTLTNAAREGAREAVVFRSPCNQAAVVSSVTTTVNTVTSAMGLGSPTVNVNGPCTGSGNPSTVTVTAPYSFQVLPGLAGVPSNVTLTASSVMRNE